MSTMQRWALGALISAPSHILLRIADHMGALKPIDYPMFSILIVICIVTFMWERDKK